MTKVLEIEDLQKAQAYLKSTASIFVRSYSPKDWSYSPWSNAQFGLKLKQAFTLTELLVCVIIVSILATLAIAQYGSSKKRVEYNSARSLVRTIAAAQKSYLLSQDTYTDTANTADTNAVLDTRISDGYFQNYRANLMPGPPQSFNISVDAGACAYTFDSAGARVADNGAGDCLSD